MYQVQIASTEDLPKLVSLMQLWLRSPASVRGQLDQWMLRSVTVSLPVSDLPIQDTDFPDVCICGEVLATTGSRLRTWCRVCKGRLGMWTPVLLAPAWVREYVLATAMLTLKPQQREWRYYEHHG